MQALSLDVPGCSMGYQMPCSIFCRRPLRPTYPTGPQVASMANAIARSQAHAMVSTVGGRRDVIVLKATREEGGARPEDEWLDEQLGSHGETLALDGLDDLTRDVAGEGFPRLTRVRGCGRVWETRRGRLSARRRRGWDPTSRKSRRVQRMGSRGVWNCVD